MPPDRPQPRRCRRGRLPETSSCCPSPYGLLRLWGKSPCAITVRKGRQGGRGVSQDLWAALIACRAPMSVIKYHVNRQSQGFHGVPVLFACVDQPFKLIFRTVLSLSMGGNH